MLSPKSPVRNSTVVISIFLSFLFFLPAFSFAQGAKADYQRALSLRKTISGKVFQQTVRPTWSEDNSFFWYHNDLPDGKKEFILVDVKNAIRRDAFNHQKLAGTLSDKVDEKIAADHLPIKNVTFKSLNEMTFSHKGKWWNYSLETGRLEPFPDGQKTSDSLKPRKTYRASGSSGQDTSITFHNHTDQVLTIYWINTSGQKQSYGTVEPGKTYQQHTYVGHVWLITNKAESNGAVFTAIDGPGNAVVEEDTLFEDVRRERRRPRRPQRQNRGGSPDNKWTAFIKDHNLYLRNMETDEETALTTDGTADNYYQDRFYFSPDSRKVLVMQVEKGFDRKIHLIESSPDDQLQPKLHTLSYTKPGDKIDHPRPHLFDIENAEQIDIAEELFPNPWSISNIRWLPDSSRFLFYYNQRGHQLLRIIAVDAQSGQAEAVIDEQSDTFIDYAGKFFCDYLFDSNEIIWMSERDGWNHLYLYDMNTGQVKNQITRGEWVVRNVEHVDKDAREIWFWAGGIHPDQDPYYRHFCRVNFDGSNLVVLTDGDGSHSIEFSPDRTYFLDTWSRVDMPGVTELREARTGRLICPLELADWSPLLRTGWTPPERFVAKGRDGTTDICGIIIRPSNFDPEKTYPVIENIYAGPHSAFVPKSFNLLARMHSMAELGFILVKIDGMGTSHRSKAFHDVCWKNLGDSGFPDRILWMKAAAKKYPCMDLSRVGLYGGSAGGQSTLRGLLAHGDFYKVGVADCGCHDNRMDKIWWNELWMGWPVGPHYKEQSNVTNAHKLQGKLMLSVGELDRNVDPASTLQVVDALIKADKDFRLLYVPGHGHGVGGIPWANRQRMDFFVRHLLHVEPRHER